MSDEQITVETAPKSVAEPQAGFTAGDLSFNSAEAKYYFSNFIQPVTIHHNHERGEVIGEFPIDLRLHGDFRDWALNYLDYRFDRLAFEWTPVSPMGTTSGMAKAYFIPDPNISCMHNTTTFARHHNLLQAARAEVAADLRPRMATDFNISTAGVRFTQNDGLLRFGSYGKVVIVVVSPPQVGDYCEWHVKLSGNLLLTRPTTATYNRIKIEEATIKSLSFITPPGMSDTKERLARDVEFAVTFKDPQPGLNFAQAVVYFDQQLTLTFASVVAFNNEAKKNHTAKVSRGILRQIYDSVNDKFVFKIQFVEVDLGKFRGYVGTVTAPSNTEFGISFEVPSYDDFQSLGGTYL